MGHAFDCRRCKFGAAGDMQFVKSSPDVSPTSRQNSGVIAAVGPGKTVIGRIAIDLQNAAIAAEMTRDTFARATVLEAVGDHWRSTAAEGSIISSVSPEIGRFCAAGSRRQSRQRGFIGKDPLALFDQGE